MSSTLNKARTVQSFATPPNERDAIRSRLAAKQGALRALEHADRRVELCALTFGNLRARAEETLAEATGSLTLKSAAAKVALSGRTADLERYAEIAKASDKAVEEAERVASLLADAAKGLEQAKRAQKDARAKYEALR